MFHSIIKSPCQNTQPLGANCCLIITTFPSGDISFSSLCFLPHWWSQTCVYKCSLSDGSRAQTARISSTVWNPSCTTKARCGTCIRQPFIPAAPAWAVSYLYLWNHLTPLLTQDGPRSVSWSCCRPLRAAKSLRRCGRVLIWAKPRITTSVSKTGTLSICLKSSYLNSLSAVLYFNLKGRWGLYKGSRKVCYLDICLIIIYNGIICAKTGYF